MITSSGLFVVDTPVKAESRPSLMLSGSRFRSDEDGYYGELIVRKGDAVVRLRVTDKQADTLAKMDIAEYT